MSFKEAKAIMKARNHSKMAAMDTTVHRPAPTTCCADQNRWLFRVCTGHNHLDHWSPLCQMYSWSFRTLPLSDQQHDNKTSAAGTPTTWQTLTSVLVTGEWWGESFPWAWTKLQLTLTVAFMQRCTVSIFEWRKRRRKKEKNLTFMNCVIEKERKKRRIWLLYIYIYIYIYISVSYTHLTLPTRRTV